MCGPCSYGVNVDRVLLRDSVPQHTYAAEGCQACFYIQLDSLRRHMYDGIATDGSPLAKLSLRIAPAMLVANCHFSPM